MPTRPSSPSLPGILRDQERRLRALERTRPGFVPPKDDSYIEVWDDGEPQGLFRLIDFVGGVVTVQPREDGIAEVNIVSGESPFDAIVDGTAGASDPDSLLFLGIGEASQFCYDAGLTANAVIGVRNFSNDAHVGAAYTETADWDSPSNLRIVGLRATGDASTGNSTNTFWWNWNGFKPNNAGMNLQLENCALFEPRGGPTVNPPFTNLVLRNSELSMNAFSTTIAVCSSLVADMSSIRITTNGNRRLASANATLVQCDVVCQTVSGGTITFIPAGTGASSLLTMVGCRWQGPNTSGTVTVTLPPKFDMDISDPDIRVQGGSDGSPFPTLNVPANADGRIRAWSGGLTGVWIVNATSAFNRLILEGHFGNLTITGAHDVLAVHGVSNVGTWDLLGPASVTCALRGAGKLILRGEGIAGHVGGDGLTGSSGTVVDFVAADHCNIVAGIDGTGTSGTKKPYAFDASSDRNILDCAGASTFPTAGTDLGAGNMIRTT